MEGSPTQELSAIEIDAKSKIINDIFHEYGDYSPSDYFARKHVHGLSEDFLTKHSIGPESKLIQAFLTWVRPKRIKAIYANNPGKESTVLGIPIQNFSLHNWVDRQHQSYHQMSLKLKSNGYPIFQQFVCPKAAHNMYVCPPVHKNPEIAYVKQKHGYHCSLYDVMELYLAFYDSLYENVSL